MAGFCGVGTIALIVALLFAGPWSRDSGTGSADAELAASAANGEDAAASADGPSSVGLRLEDRNQTETIDELFEDVEQSAPGFGGMFFDEQGRLNVYLQEPADLAAVEEAIASVFGADRIPDEGIQVLVGEYSFSELNDWHARMAEVLAIPGVVFTDIDEGANRLRVGVEEPGLVSVVEERLAALGIPQAAVQIEETEPFVSLPTAGNTLRDKIRPLVGGLQIQFDVSKGTFNCTLGFIAKLGNQTGFLTNSHCTQKEGAVEGTVYGQPKPADKVGVEAKDPPFFGCTAPLPKGTPTPGGQNCRHSDSAFVHLNDPADGDLGFLARTNPIGSLNIEKKYRIVEVKAQPVVGEKLNKVGRTTGWSQGPVTATCQNVKVSTSPPPPPPPPTPVPPAPTYKLLLCQDVVAAAVAGGDSGSPVFGITNSPNQNDVRLYGILWGGTPGGKIFVFSNMGQVQRELGPLTALAPGVTPVKPTTPVPTKTPEVQQNFAFVNNTTAKASDLTVVFDAPVLRAKPGTTAKLNGTPVPPQPAACPTPIITLPAGDTVTVVWPTKCVQKGEQVIIGVTSSKKPLKVLSVTWTNGGTPIATQTPTTTPTPNPKKLQTFTFFNNTTGKASDLRVQFGTALISVAVISPPVCTLDAGASGFAGGTVTIVWTSKCVQKNQQVTLRVTSQTNPLKVSSVTWTNAGTPLPKQTPQTPTPKATPTHTPTPTPCPPEGCPAVAVGGIVDEIPDSVSTQLEAPGSGSTAGVLAGAIAGMVAVSTVSLGGAIWYLRRRRVG